jgi:hypothetical protein
MIRVLIVAAALAAAPAAAQTPVATPELTRAQQAIGALWRPVEGTVTADAIRAACAGAEQELLALDAAMPAELNAESAARVRGLRGLHIILLLPAPWHDLVHQRPWRLFRH